MKFLNLSVVIIILTVSAGCYSTNQKNSSTEVNKSASFLTVKSNDYFAKSDKARFVIENTISEQAIFLFHPMEITIQERINESWEQVSVLYCPCGASCPPPPEFRKLPPGEKKVITWDLNEEWCEEANAKDEIPQTKRKYAGAGTYRFVVKYSMDKGKAIHSVYRTFKLK
jgi:hypothetical protein